MKKTLLSVAFSLFATFMGHAFTVDGLTYSLADNVATVTGASDRSITSLRIPSHVNYGGTSYLVQYLASHAFRNYTSLRELVIEDCETFIGCHQTTNELGHTVAGNPFEGCPLEKIYLGRNIGLVYSNGDVRADLVPIYSTAESVDLTIAGQSTTILSGNVPGTFSNRTNIASLTIGASVTTVQTKAFVNNAALKKIVIQPGEQSIYFKENDAFAGCPVDTMVIGRKSLYSNDWGGAEMNVVVIPGDTPPDMDQMFRNQHIGHLIIEESDTPFYGNHIFRFCTIDSAYVNRIRINSGLFADTQIKHVTFGPKITELNLNYVYNHSELESVKFSDSLTRIGRQALQLCTGLTTIDLPSSLKVIENSAFQECTGITSIDIPASVDSICGSAFSISGLTEIVIPSTVKYVGESAFYRCEKLRTVTIEDSDYALDEKDLFRYCTLDSVYVGRERTTSSLFYGASIKHVTFGPKITELNLNYVYNHSELESVKFSDSLTRIGRQALQLCTGLTTIDLPSSLKVIDNRAFQECTGITSIAIPASVDSICGSAFSTSGLTEIVIPSTVKYVGESAFYRCEKLRTITIEDSDYAFDEKDLFRYCTLDSVYVGRERTTPSLFYGASIKHVTFGPKITELNSNYVYNHSELESVKFSDSLTRIGRQALQLCTGLTTIDLPSSLKEIGNSAFQECTGITSIAIPASVDSICGSAFSTSGLTEIVIPSTVKYVGESAFYRCEKLRTVTIEDSDYAFDEEDIFKFCTLDSVYVGRERTTFGLFPYASVKHVTFGPKITELNSNYVINHSELESIKLPASLTSIGSYALAGCTGLQSIITEAKIPPVCEDRNVFDNLAYENAQVVVPIGSKKAYKASEVWKEFRNLRSDAPGYNVRVEYISGSGYVTINGIREDSALIEEDDSLTVGLCPSEGYEVSALIVNGEDMTGSLVDGTINFDELDANMEIKVGFSKITYSVTIDHSAGGSLTVTGVDEESGRAEYGSRIEIRAVADRGHELSSLSVNGKDLTDSMNSNQVIAIDPVTEDISVEALFSPIVYSARIEGVSAYGSVKVNDSENSCGVEYGQRLEIQLVPARDGCYLESLIVNDTDVTDQVADNKYVIERMEEDIVVKARFAIHTYRVEFVYDHAQGEISDGTGADEVEIEHGQDMHITIVAAEGFEIESVMVDGKDMTDKLSTAGVLTLKNVTASHRVEVAFAIKRVKLTILGLEGGHVGMIYDYGTDVTLSVEAYDQWVFSSLSVGEDVVTSLDPDGLYNVGPITDDMTVSVVFRLDESGMDSPAPVSKVVVSASHTTVSIYGAEQGSEVQIFDTAGMLLYRGVDQVIDLRRQGVMIVTVAGQTFKVILR